MDPERILLIRMGGIGDIVFTLPAIQWLRDCFPKAKISYLTSKEFVPLLEGFPGIERIIPIDRALYRRRNIGEIGKALTGTIADLRNSHYQLVIDFQGFGETGWLARLSGAKQRWGIVRKPGRRFFYTDYLTYFQNDRHAAERNIDLLRKAGLRPFPIQNKYSLPQDAIEKARKLLEELKIESGKPLLFIQPFSNYQEKNWPLERYVAIAEHWQKQGFSILFGGGPSEALQLTELTGKFPVSAGKANLMTSAGLMHFATIILGGDTGLLHLAVAMGKRIVMLLSWPEFFGPYQHPDWAVTPASGRNMHDISVDQVIDTLESAWNELQEDNLGTNH